VNSKVLYCIGCSSTMIFVENQGELTFGWSLLSQYICSKCNPLNFNHIIDEHKPSALLKCKRCGCIIGLFIHDAITPLGLAGSRVTYYTSNCKECLVDKEVIGKSLTRIVQLKKRNI